MFPASVRQISGEAMMGRLGTSLLHSSEANAYLYLLQNIIKMTVENQHQSESVGIDKFRSTLVAL